MIMIKTKESLNRSDKEQILLHVKIVARWHTSFSINLISRHLFFQARLLLLCQQGYIG